MILIGEKLNGAIPVIQKAITEKDDQLIRERAKLQADAGADFIDVHASRNEGETEILGWMIDQVQAVTDVPVCIDSPDPEVCVEAMKFCRKEGLINSVSMEKNKTKIVFPAIADTSWQCVALLCSDKYGIPQSVEQRMEVMDEIMAESLRSGFTSIRWWKRSRPMRNRSICSANAAGRSVRSIRRFISPADCPTFLLDFQAERP